MNPPIPNKIVNQTNKSVFESVIKRVLYTRYRGVHSYLMTEEVKIAHALSDWFCSSGNYVLLHGAALLGGAFECHMGASRHKQVK